MCYSAQIEADFRNYQRLGGTVNIAEFVKLAGWARKNGTWIKSVPKGSREALLSLSVEPGFVDEFGEEAAQEIAATQAAGIADITADLERQQKRIAAASAALASSRPTKAAEKEIRIATEKRDAALRRLEAEEKPVQEGETERIWPGYFCPVLIRDSATGERIVVPMRYRCRLPGWTEADERQKPGTYNARRDKLSTVWRKLYGRNHGIVVASDFYESVSLHRLQRRELAPGERDIAVEIKFTPEPAQDMYLACLWRYVEASADDPGFYTFAIITRDPPPEVREAGHDRCVIPIRAEHLDSWLNPDPGNLSAVNAILDHPIDAYYGHQVPRLAGGGN